MPPRIEATSTLPSGFGVFENTTFVTSCAYNDPACYAKCTNMATACGSKWFQWTHENSHLTFTQSPTSFSTTTITSQSYSYSTSVVQEGKALRTFDYASPVGNPIATTTSVRTLYSMERIVTRWTEPPPTCTPSAWLKCTKGPDCRACTVQGGTVEVLFWPPETRGAGSKSTVDSQRFANESLALRDVTSQPPVTAMFGTHTLTSPSVYISFQTAYALNDCGHTVGKAMPGALLPMNPHSLFTMRAALDYFEVTSGSIQTTFYESASFNYDDFNGPVPPSAYTNQPSCLASGCYTIYPDYHPQLALPPQVRGMDPAWESCALDWRGAWDPPIALSQAESIAVPTNPAEPILTEPASPKSTMDSPAKVTSSLAEFKAPSPVASSEVEVTRRPSVTFVYSPIISSNEIEPDTTPRTSQFSTNVPIVSSSVQITTIVQADPRPGADTGTESNAYSVVDTKVPAETIVKGETHTTATEASLAIPDKTIVAGESPIISSAHSVASEGGSVPSTIISSSSNPASPPSHSPTNAYEVLSEALGTAAGHPTTSFDISFSAIASQSTSSPSTKISASNPTLTYAPLPHAVLDFGSTTITAVRHSSNLIQIGDQSLSLQSSTVVVIEDHTLSASSGAIVVDGSSTAVFSSSTMSSHSTSAITGTSTSTVESLPSVEGSGSGQALPSVTTETPADDGEGDVSSEDEGDDDTSGASRMLRASILWCLFGVTLFIAIAM